MRTQSICSFKCEHSINHPTVLLLKPSCLLNSNTRIRKLRLKKKKKKQKSTDFTNLVSNILFAFGRMIPGCLKQKETLLSQETEGQSFLPRGRRRRGRGTARLRAEPHCCRHTTVFIFASRNSLLENGNTQMNGLAASPRPSPPMDLRSRSVRCVGDPPSHRPPGRHSKIS